MTYRAGGNLVLMGIPHDMVSDLARPFCFLWPTGLRTTLVIYPISKWEFSFFTHATLCMRQSTPLSSWGWIAYFPGVDTLIPRHVAVINIFGDMLQRRVPLLVALVFWGALGPVRELQL